MAKILLFEDDPFAIEMAQALIIESGHEHVGTAESITKAQNFLAQVISREFDVDILMLDGNLSKKEAASVFKVPGSDIIIQPEEKYAPLGADARMVQRIIKASGIELPIIGISASPMKDSGVEADVDLTKTALYIGDSTEFNEIVNSLLPPAN